MRHDDRLFAKRASSIDLPSHNSVLTPSRNVILARDDIFIGSRTGEVGIRVTDQRLIEKQQSYSPTKLPGRPDVASMEAVKVGDQSFNYFQN